MCEHHGIDHVDASRQKLHSQLRRRVEQQTRSRRRLDHGAHSCPPVSRISRMAHRAPASELRDSEARSGAEEGELHTRSTLSRFVVPGTSKGTPAVTTTRSPGDASWRRFAAAVAHITISLYV